MDDKKEREKKTDAFAEGLLRLASDTIIVSMRFLDVALGKLPPMKRKGFGRIASDGGHFYYDPVYILKEYTKDPAHTARAYLHTLLHFIFNHSFGYDRLDKELWDLSCDIAVENMIMELDEASFSLTDDDRRRIRLKGLKKGVERMTAEKIYRYFLANPPADSGLPELKALFFKDDHIYWSEVQNFEITRQEWKKINERIKAELKSFSKSSSHSESLIGNLEEASKERHDYKGLLERFVTRDEELGVSEDEFDYIYYTYGLEHYGDMPFIEPLEFRDVKKVKEFAIILDTSASCRGDIVRSFLIKTYEIISSSETFFQKVNIHIIQCDNEVQSDTKIENRGDFDAFVKTGRFIGYGGTDFRPAFEYVEKLKADGEFVNLKGVIYFTDGYGIYPEREPDFECIFAFISEDEYKPQVPWWGIPVVLDSDDIAQT